MPWRAHLLATNRHVLMFKSFDRHLLYSPPGAICQGRIGHFNNTHSRHVASYSDRLASVCFCEGQWGRRGAEKSPRFRLSFVHYADHRYRRVVVTTFTPARKTRAAPRFQTDNTYRPGRASFFSGIQTVDASGKALLERPASDTVIGRRRFSLLPVLITHHGSIGRFVCFIGPCWGREACPKAAKKQWC